MSRFGLFVFLILFVTTSCLPENERDPKSAAPFFLINRLCSPTYINNVQLKQLICLVCKILDPSCLETTSTTTEGQTASTTTASVVYTTSLSNSTNSGEQKIETTTIKQTTKEEQAETEE